VTNSGGTNCTVMIVDDDADARATLGQFLETQGYWSFDAENGQEAIKQLRASVHPSQLILLDLEMLVMDGWDFLLRLQQLNATALYPP
jgi:chemotaxis family two-component system sensor histidine kinase/response regulator PixL